MNINELEKQRRAAEQDKADLFDFYHENWDKLIQYIEDLEKSRDSYRNQVDSLPYSIEQVRERLFR